MRISLKIGTQQFLTLAVNYPQFFQCLNDCNFEMEQVRMIPISFSRLVNNFWTRLSKLSWVVNGEQINYLPKPEAKANNWSNYAWAEYYYDSELRLSWILFASKHLWASLSNHDDDCYKNPTNLHIWHWKTVFLHALHVHLSSFDILETFSFFLRREMTCFAVVWTTRAYDDKCSILSSCVPSAGSNLIPG